MMKVVSTVSVSVFTSAPPERKVELPGRWSAGTPGIPRVERQPDRCDRTAGAARGNRERGGRREQPDLPAAGQDGLNLDVAVPADFTVGVRRNNNLRGLDLNQLSVTSLKSHVSSYRSRSDCGVPIPNSNSLAKRSVPISGKSCPSFRRRCFSASVSRSEIR